MSVSPGRTVQSSVTYAEYELPAEVLVRIAERDRARLRQPEQEVGEVEAGGRAGEAERAARILLSDDVVPDRPRLDPEPDVVRAAEA